jgi:hypothetical protein
MHTPAPTLKQKFYRAMKEYLGISCYLWIIFALFVLYKSVLMSEQGIPYVAQGVALFNALALGKVMLIAQELHFAEHFKEKPLLYSTLFKSAAFALILGVFKVLEEAGVGLYHGRSLSESFASISGGTLKGIFVQLLLLAILLIPFFGFSELNRVFGKDKLRRLFFVSRQDVPNSPAK